MSDDLRTEFHQDLDEVRQEVARLSASVTELIPRVTDVLLDQDLEGAEYAILGDDEIDARSIELEERCYRLLALQAPVATDLRGIIAAIKLIGEIERSADLCVNVCKAARRIYGRPLDPKLRGLIQRMGAQAHRLFKEATEAYLNRDSARAAALHDMDSLLDDLHREFIQAIFESHSHTAIDLQVAVQLALVARFFERIGDHAVNIGEKVRYEVDAWMPELAGAARYRARTTGEVPAVEAVLDAVLDSVIDPESDTD